MSLEAGMELAKLYREAVDELAQHWPDAEGECIGCGDAYPCAAEWITQRAIIGIEARWHRAARPPEEPFRALTAGPTGDPDRPARKDSRTGSPRQWRWSTAA
jgi:hypothetical protein